MSERRDLPPEIQSLPARQTELGDLKIQRALPRSRRRMVGAWCFLDRFGPLRFGSEKPMDVAPHPHMGLQTVSWLFDGEIVHHDSLRYEALMRAGQLNLMTSGSGIAHSEETPRTNSGILSGVQMWVALPGSRREMSPAFHHYAELPVFDAGGGTVRLIAGSLLGHSSPAMMFTPIVGADISLRESQPLLLPLERHFEYAMFVLDGNVLFDRQSVASGALHYFGTGREEMEISGSRDSRVLLLGGEPFNEPILMWWNFVAGTHEEIAHAREDWIRHERFGEVQAYKGSRLPAPDLGNLASANPAS